MRKNIAVILAGGKGERFNSEMPKQFAKVAGKSVIEHTIGVFERSNRIDEIAVVINPDYLDRLEGLVLKNSWNKLKKILLGGKERYHSSLAAINAYRDEKVNLIFHDAVRPLIDAQIIEEVVEKLTDYDAVDVAIPATDTIIEVDVDKKIITNIPNREFLYQGQTPQGFKNEIIAQAYEIALNDSQFRTTDDCGVVKTYLPNVPIGVVLGARKNIKLTHMEDLYLIDKLYQLNAISNNRENIDYHTLSGKVMVVFGGNAGIGKEMINFAKTYSAKTYSFSRSTTNTDISKIEDVEKALKEVYAKERRIDYIVVAAAVLKIEAFHTMDPMDIAMMVNINYLGMINVSRCAYEYLKETQGQLLHFTSSSYTLGRPFYSMYSSSKAAVVNFVQALAQEWNDSKIRVNCINPERTLTEMRTKNFGIEDPKTLLKAEDVAKVSISTLLSNFTGQVVDVRINNKN